MNPTVIEGTSETAPLKPAVSSKSLLSVGYVSRTFGTTYFLISTLIASIIPFIQLGFGLYYKGECPIDQRIPTYMIVAGICGLTLVALSVTLALTFICFIPESRTLTLLASFGVGLNILAIIFVTIFMFIWFILGCVWVFSARDQIQFHDPMKTNYCQPVLYKWSFTILIITILWAFCQCCLSCFRLCCIGQSA